MAVVMIYDDKRLVCVCVCMCVRDTGLDCVENKNLFRRASTFECH